MKIMIRNALTDDATTIARFNALMAMESEGKALEQPLIGAGVAAVLADSGKGRYWLAEVDDQVVGQIMVTYEWSDWRNGMWWWIQSVYIHVDHRRQGVFSALYHHVESLARSGAGICGIRLYVEENNTRAQKTYRSLGMTAPGYLVMETDFQKKSD